MSGSDLRELREIVREFVRERDWEQYHSPRNVAAALACEAAELQEIYLWRQDDDHADEHRESVQDEVGDVLMLLLSFCNATGIDPAEALLGKLVKARAKYPVERVKGRREKYDEYPEYDGEGQ